MTVWVGLTGGIGSGKSQVAAIFSEYGVPVVDADAVSRSLTADGGAALPAIRAQFGDGVFSGEQLNRSALRELVFRQPERKAQLESILFPLIYREIVLQQQSCRAVYGIVDIPLLTEKPQFQWLVERILVVDCSKLLQIQRVQARSGLSESEIQSIMNTQAARSERCAIADDILVNEGTLRDLRHKVARLHQFYQAVFADSLQVSS